MCHCCRKLPRWPTGVIRYTKRFVLWKGLSSVSYFQGIGYKKKKNKNNKLSERVVDLKGTKGEGPASVVLRRERPVP